MTDPSTIDPSTVTLAQGTIHNPAEPRHFMRLRTVPGTVTIKRNDGIIARSTRAVRLMEVAGDVYDPVFYVPREDVVAPMATSETTTFCPLKGEASYLSLVAEDGSVSISDIAWFHAAPLDFAHELEGLVAFYATHVAFYATHVTFEEAPT